MSAQTEAFLFCTVAAEVLLTCRNNNVETLEHIEPKLNFHFGNYRRKMRHVSYYTLNFLHGHINVSMICRFKQRTWFRAANVLTT